MKTGIIMEINERFLTLLTPEGEFLRARKLNNHYQIGQEIDFFPVDNAKTKKSSFFSIFNIFKGKPFFVAAFVLIFAIISIIPIIPSSQGNEVYAYMSIDINPSIELGVNEKCQVIELLPYNEAGKQIIKKITDWKEKDINDVTSSIINEIKKQGYTENNHEIVIATVYTQEEKKENNRRLEEEMAEIKKVVQKENLDLTILEGTEKDREKALDKGLTTGLYKENKIKMKAADTEDKKQPSNAAPLKEKEKNKAADNKKPFHKPDRADDLLGKPGKTKSNIHAPQAEKFKEKRKVPEQVKKQRDKHIPRGHVKKRDEKHMSPGQEKKNREKHMSPGQEKKNREKQMPPGWEKKNREKQLPSGKEKKHSEKHIPPGQWKKHDKKELERKRQGINKHNNKHRNKSNNEKWERNS